MLRNGFRHIKRPDRDKMMAARGISRTGLAKYVPPRPIETEGVHRHQADFAAERAARHGDDGKPVVICRPHLLEFAVEKQRHELRPGTLVVGAHQSKRYVALDRDRGAYGEHDQDRIHEWPAGHEELDDRVREVHYPYLLNMVFRCSCSIAFRTRLDREPRRESRSSRALS